MKTTEKITRQRREFEHVMTQGRMLQNKADGWHHSGELQNTENLFKLKEREGQVCEQQTGKVSNFSEVSDLGELPIK